jgi:hypothetical protein
MPDGSWFRTVGFEQARTVQPTDSHQPRTATWIQPKTKLDLTAFPLWLRSFDNSTQQSISELSDKVKHAGIVQHTARALLALRYREPIPDTVDIAAVEKEVKQWLLNHQITS